jgi:hypothetical protein
MPNSSFLGHLAPPVEPLDAVAIDRIRGGMHRAGSPRRRRRLLAAPALLVVALPVLVFALGSGGGNEPAFAAEAIRVAESAPRLLLDGWNITRADEWQPGRGEMTFSDGNAQFELRWLPGSEYPGMLRTLTDKWTPAGTARAAGIDAQVYRGEGGSFSALWVDGDSSVQAIGEAADLAAFTRLLERLEHAGVNGWLRAMPADVVRPAAEHATVVDEMLQGLPLPPSLNVAALRQSGSVRDRYQLGGQVSGAVACGWIAQYIAARKRRRRRGGEGDGDLSLLADPARDERPGRLSRGTVDVRGRAQRHAAAEGHARGELHLGTGVSDRLSDPRQQSLSATMLDEGHNARRRETTWKRYAEWFGAAALRSRWPSPVWRSSPCRRRSPRRPTSARPP